MAAFQQSSPLLGTPYILALSTPPSTSTSASTTRITPSLCANLSAFKSLLRASRSYDDSIILRLNRADALARSAADGRTGTSGVGVGDAECGRFWDELVARWTERGEVLGFCEGVMGGQQGQTVEEGRSKRESRWGVEKGLDADRTVLGRGDSEREVKVCAAPTARVSPPVSPSPSSSRVDPLTY